MKKESNSSILVCSVEAWAFLYPFVRRDHSVVVEVFTEIAVSADFRPWVQPAQFHQQGKQGSLLSFCASVLGLATAVDTAYIRNADAVSIVTADMCANHINVTSRLDSTVQAYNVMVAYITPSLCLVPSYLCPAFCIIKLTKKLDILFIPASFTTH